MLSRLRKIFYGSDGWDKYLIPGAASIPSGYTNYTIDYPGYPKYWPTGTTPAGTDLGSVEYGFNFKDQNCIPTDGSKMTPDVFWNQEIQIECCPSGIIVDIGHVLAGLDAHNNPTEVGFPGLQGIGVMTVSSNKDAVTWVGELGSVIAEIHWENDKMISSGSQISETEMQNIIARLAPPADIIGDIDAYVIAAKYDISTGMLISDILRDYYLGSGQIHQKHRFSIFASVLNLGWNGTEFTNLEGEKLKQYKNDVQSAAALFTAKGALASSVADAIVAATEVVPQLLNSSLAKIHIVAFFDQIKAGILVEE
jgi:hypothetical protein